LLSAKVVDEYLEAKVLGIKTHLVLLGPMSFVLVDKPTGGSVTRSEVLEAIVPLYQTLLSHLRAASAEWV
jgi:5-methyltetrahydropteroyltriglutamate--homocysteine methyltransferase